MGWPDGTFVARSGPELPRIESWDDLAAAMEQARRHVDEQDAFRAVVVAAVREARDRGMGVVVNRTDRTATPSPLVPEGEVLIVTPPTLEEVARRTR